MGDGMASSWRRSRSLVALFVFTPGFWGLPLVFTLFRVRFHGCLVLLICVNAVRQKVINRLWHLIVSTCILKCWSRNRFVSWSQAEDIYSKFCVKCTLWRLLLENCPVLKYYRKIDKFICKSHVQRTDISELPQSERGRFSKKINLPLHVCFLELHGVFLFTPYRVKRTIRLLKHLLSAAAECKYKSTKSSWRWHDVQLLLLATVARRQRLYGT